MSQTVAFNSMGKGELSPFVRGRIDTLHYYSSAKSLQNMIVRPYGDPVRRAGTKYVAATKSPTKDVRLIEFVFSTDTSFDIEMGEFYFRFYKNNERVTLDLSTATEWADATEYVGGDLVYVTGKGTYICTADHESDTTDNKPDTGTDWADFWFLLTTLTASGTWDVEITHPYTEAQIWDVDYAQKDDVIKMTHQLHDIAELRRYSDSEWAFVQNIIFGPPWEELNDDKQNSLLQEEVVKGNTGFLIAEKDTFVASDVGRYFRIGGFNVYGEQGYVRITSIISKKIAATYVEERLYDGLPFQTTRWSRNAFYEDNYPANVTYHESRLVFANTPSDPQREWFSKSFIYNDFNVGEDPSMGFDLTLNTEQANEIKWISSGNSLATGTYGSEFISSSPSDSSINDINKNARRQSNWGSTFVRPKKIGNRLYFLQRGLRKLRELFFVWDNNNYDAKDMTKYSEHITLGGVVDMDYQRNQDSLLWCVLGNGKMAILSRDPDDDIMAWTPFITDGDVKSIRFTPNPNGLTDRGMIIVERTIDGNTVKYLESFDNHVIEDTTEQADLYYVDCGVVYDDKSSATDTPFTGLDHLEGESVMIFADGLAWGSETVENGSVPSNYGVWLKAAVGLSYTSVVQPNPLNAQTPTGMAKGKIRRIHSISLDIYKSLNMEYSSDGTNWFPIGVPEGTDEDVLFTGTIPNLTFEGILDYTGYIYLRQRLPYPMNLLGIYARVLISEGK